MTTAADRPIYLDHNATTPVCSEAREAMLPWLGEAFGNPSSGHAYGRRARQALEHARAQVAAAVGALPASIVFTKGGTEADNLAILGTRLSYPRLVTSAVEHPAVTYPAGVRQASGIVWDTLSVGRDGIVDLKAAHTVLERPTGLLSVILAQNEVGTLQPVRELAAIARAVATDVIVHTDAAQAVGKVAVDVDALGVDLLTIVSHKLYGPCGIGALFIRSGVELEPLLGGGGQERGLSPGTESLPLAVGFGAACEAAIGALAEEKVRLEGLRERLWTRMSAGVSGLVRTTGCASGLPNTLHVCFRDQDGAEILDRSPAIAASTGSACHAGDATVSGTLGEMGLDVSVARGAVRLSLGRSTTPGDVDRAASALIAAAKASASAAAT